MHHLHVDRVASGRWPFSLQSARNWSESFQCQQSNDGDLSRVQLPVRGGMIWEIWGSFVEVSCPFNHPPPATQKTRTCCTGPDEPSSRWLILATTQACPGKSSVRLSGRVRGMQQAAGGLVMEATRPKNRRLTSASPRRPSYPGFSRDVSLALPSAPSRGSSRLFELKPHRAGPARVEAIATLVSPSPS
jgi:hypothetical protein